MKEAPSILVAGVGNILRGDDGFGVVAAQRLMLRTDLPPNVKVIETGIGGMSLVHELMDGYDALILLDAVQHGGKPGRLYLLEPQLPDIATLDAHERRDYFADTHYATPNRALALLSAVASLPPVVRVIGCEVESFEEFTIGLNPTVEAAADRAVNMALELLADLRIELETR